MPRRKFPKKPEGVAMTAIELCQHDDVCTDILVDQTHYHTTIPKCKVKWTPLRGVDEETIVGLIHRYTVTAQDVEQTLQRILELEPVKRYVQQLDTDIEKKRFTAHLKMYIAMYQPDCGWEVCSTNRYTISSYEAAVCARGEIKPGLIPYLCGTTVKLTRMEEDLLDTENRAFSVMASTKREAARILLGPARFVNHDCMPNATLRPSEGKVEVVAVRTIHQGEEITVNYGGCYFGPDNMDCLCASCEVLGRGGWRGSGRDCVSDTTAVYRDECRVPSEYLIMRRWLATQKQCQIGGRRPFDYVLTRSLLVQPYDRWSQCHNVDCGHNFVQGEGYQVRRWCPRCERHFRIYRSPWPIVNDDGLKQVPTADVAKGEQVEGRCGKGRWISEEVEARGWTPILRAHTLYMPTGETKKRTRQGHQMEADTARLRGDVVDIKFSSGVAKVRKSRRLH